MITSFYLYMLKGFQISYSIWFHSLHSNIVRPTGEIEVAVFTVKHREVKWLASGILRYINIVKPWVYDIISNASLTQ